MRDQTAETLLCPACAAERLSSGDFDLAYHFCDRCGGPVEPGNVEIRSKTESTQQGLTAHHWSVTMSLCPACAKAYDGTGRSLLIGMCFLVGIIVLVGFLCWVLD
jgi:hypothetical protein